MAKKWKLKNQKKVVWINICDIVFYCANQCTIKSNDSWFLRVVIHCRATAEDTHMCVYYTQWPLTIMTWSTNCKRSFMFHLFTTFYFHIHSNVWILLLKGVLAWSCHYIILIAEAYIKCKSCPLRSITTLRETLRIQIRHRRQPKGLQCQTKQEAVKK